LAKCETLPSVAMHKNNINNAQVIPEHLLFL
jgi:hypothetical protein